MVRRTRGALPLLISCSHHVVDVKSSTTLGHWATPRRDQLASQRNVLCAQARAPTRQPWTTAGAVGAVSCSDADQSGRYQCRSRVVALAGCSVASPQDSSTDHGGMQSGLVDQATNVRAHYLLDGRPERWETVLSLLVLFFNFFRMHWLSSLLWSFSCISKWTISLRIKLSYICNPKDSDMHAPYTHPFIIPWREAKQNLCRGNLHGEENVVSCQISTVRCSSLQCLTLTSIHWHSTL
jgi:hypothetical protein